MTATWICWWENTNGAGTAWKKRTVRDKLRGAIAVYAADIDGDGDMDIARAGYWGDEITWWENTNGAGTKWEMHIIDYYFDGASSVCATDIDGDGDMDVLGAATDGNDITWWENKNGTGRSWSEHIVSKFTAASVYAADLNGDQNIDLIGACGYLDDILWWDNMKYVSVGTCESSILKVNGLVSWDHFTAEVHTPNKTTIGYQFRSSNDFTKMGFWSSIISSANINLSGILADSTKYIQYKAILRTSDPSYTPTLYSVQLDYNTTVAIGDNTGEATSWDFAPAANPSYDGNCAILVSVPVAGVVNLALYDATGRVITENSQELTAGTHSVLFDNVAHGVYFCTMHAEDFTATERIIVLK